MVNMFEIRYIFFLLLIAFVHGNNKIRSNAIKNETSQNVQDNSSTRTNTKNHVIVADDRQDKPFNYINDDEYYNEQSIVPPHPFIIPYRTFNGIQNGFVGQQLIDPIRNDDIEKIQSAETSQQVTGIASPIYYFRLPPTPYIFVPNLGYSSSNMPQFIPNPNAADTTNPSHNLPVSFISNGRPQNIYQFGSQMNPFYTTFPNIYNHQLTNMKQTLLNKPRPLSVNPESKIMTLKKSFLYNGRPEEIFIMPNNLNSNTGYTMQDKPLTSYF